MNRNGPSAPRTGPRQQTQSAALPVVAIVWSPESVIEGTAATFILSRAEAPTAPRTVAVNVASEGAVLKTADGYQAPNRVVFPTGQATTYLAVETEADTVDETDGSITVTVIADQDAYTVAATQGTATVTVEDDDLPKVTLVLSRQTIAERDDPATPTNEAQTVVIATVPLAADTAFTVTVSTTLAGSYLQTPQSGGQILSFPAGATESAKAVTLTAVDNVREDGDQIVTVSGTVSDPAVAIAPDDQTLTIIDDEGLPKVTLVLTPRTVAEADNKATNERDESVSVVTATLQEAHDAAFTVTVAAAAVSPAEAGDFTLSTDKVLSFAANATESTGRVTITAADNSVDEPDKQVTVSGTVSVGATVVRPPNATTLTITDDDLPVVTLVLSPPTIAERDDTATPTNEAQTVVTATVPLAADTAFTVTVSATPAGDYTLSADRVLTFEANATVSTGSVTITAEDNVDEDGDKTVTVSGEVSNPAVAIAPDAQTLTITDDEGLPKVMLVLTPGTVEEADDTTTDGENEAQARVTARLQKAHNAAFTVTVAAAAVSPAEAGDFRLSDNPVLTFEAGATESTGSVTVTAVDNDVDEQEKQVTVSGTVSVGATAVRAPENVTLSITDNDLPAVTIAAGTTVTEGANAVFELTRAGVITKALAVTVQVTQSGAFLKAPEDYTEAVQAEFNAGSETTTLTVETEGDGTDEANGSITATVTTDSDAAYRLGTESSAKVTVEDDDLPTVTLVLAPPTIAENGTVSTVTATVPLAAGTAFTVTVSAEAVLPAVAGDFTLSDNPVLTFAANATGSTGAVTVTAENNDVDAADKQVTVSGTVSESDAAVANAPEDVTLTIKDDDLPVVTLVLSQQTIAEQDDTATNERDESVSVVTATVPLAADTAFTVTVSATPTGGYTLSENKVLTFEAGATGSIGLVTVTAENDDVDAADKQVTVSGAVSNAAVANAPEDVTLTITDDDLPKVTIAAGTSPVTEGADAVFELTRVGVTTETLTVAVEVTQSGAFLKTSEDYTAPTSAVFNAGSNTTTLTVETEADTVDEADGSITLTVIAEQDAPYTVHLTKGTATVDVTDDDLPVVTLVLSPPTIAEQDDTATPTNEAQTVVTATVPLAADTAFTVTVSATPAGGYTLSANRVLTFEANATGSTGAVTITAEDNSTEDGDKTVTVSGEVPETGVAIAPDNQTLTITDDEGLPKVTLVLTPVTVEEADDTTTDGENEAQAKVTARLQKAHNAEFTVTVSAAAVLPAEAGDFRLSDNPVLTFAAGATDSTGSVTVTAVDNDVDEQEKQVTVSGTVSVAATAVRPPNARTLTITDDDLPAVTIAAETGSVTEGANAVFELTRAGVITKALTVTVQVTQSGAFLKAPADYTEAVQAVFNAGSETTTLTAATEGDEPTR